MRILIFLAFFLASLSAHASNPVPEIVKASFEQMFPDIHDLDVHWDAREEAVVATFNEDGGLKKAFFAKDGEWLETRVRIYPSQLPRPVFRHMERSHSNADVTFLAKVLHPGGFSYRIESETFQEVVIDVMDRHGKVLENRRIPFTEGLELF